MIVKSSLRFWFIRASFEAYKRDVHAFETDTKREILFVVVCVNWATNRHWQSKPLDTRKVSQLNLFRQESVKTTDPRCLLKCLILMPSTRWLGLSDRDA